MWSRPDPFELSDTAHYTDPTYPVRQDISSLRPSVMAGCRGRGGARGGYRVRDCHRLRWRLDFDRSSRGPQQRVDPLTCSRAAWQTCACAGVMVELRDGTASPTTLPAYQTATRQGRSPSFSMHWQGAGALRDKISLRGLHRYLAPSTPNLSYDLHPRLPRPPITVNGRGAKRGGWWRACARCGTCTRRRG